MLSSLGSTYHTPSWIVLRFTPGMVIKDVVLLSAPARRSGCWLLAALLLHCYNEDHILGWSKSMGAVRFDTRLRKLKSCMAKYILRYHLCKHRSRFSGKQSKKWVGKQLTIFQWGRVVCRNLSSHQIVQIWVKIMSQLGTGDLGKPQS